MCLAQDAEQLIEALRAHVEREFARLGSSNSAGVRVKSVGDWWEADPDSKLFKMAERALTREWGRQPLFVREGGTMPLRPFVSTCVRACAAMLNLGWLVLGPSLFYSSPWRLVWQCYLERDQQQNLAGTADQSLCYSMYPADWVSM